jgi:molybdopterin/thiamine biosynthesis adenylyltransferase
MKTPISLRIDEPLFRRLFSHLFPGDHDEHGAVIAAGVATSDRGTRLLAREVFLAKDGVDYVPGTRGYRALTAKFVAEVSDYCAREKLCYLAVHCHGGTDSVAFSGDDLASHERGYPALVDILRGGPMGGLVFAANAVAGDIWTSAGRFSLDYMTVVGPRVRTLYPSPRGRPRAADPMYDRHARLFGDLGQDILTRLKVGIIGLGGGGSLMSEWLARLGVGHIVGIDFDRVTPSNLPRVVGATRWDAMTFLAKSRYSWLRRLGWSLARYKVHVARRVARQANRSVRYDAVVGNILDEETARLLADSDFLVLASDTIQSRLVFNALVQQYLIPGVQIGAKVTTNKATRAVEEIFVTTRVVLPSAGSGCFHCHELIPAGKLQEEALTADERRAQRYIDDAEVAEPSVITLNALSAAQAANDLMMMFTGLYNEGLELRHRLHFARGREYVAVEPMKKPDCLDCSAHQKSRRARGDRARLPCRAPRL